MSALFDRRSVLCRHALLAALIFPGLLLTGCIGEEEALDPVRYPIIPMPADADGEEGEFVMTEGTRVVLASGEDSELRAVVDRWAGPIRAASGFPLPVVGADDGLGRRDVIRIELEEEEGSHPVAAGMGLAGQRAEGYELKVSPRRIDLKAEGKAGIFYGLTTLEQLIPGLGSGGGGATQGEEASPWGIPAVQIDDLPRFAYRGMHLDVGRHFFPVPFIKRYIDLLAAYKMNVFHWHLTEDQGWRMEILGYPRLTEVGSCRSETMVEKNFNPYVGDGTPYCGFYTQEEAREIVEYARERFITVIPEIEMPGHSVAALAAYPVLACTPGPFQVSTVWGVTRDIFCPKEETFAFLEDVLTEVMGIFPSPYIHIGGDEAPKTRWEESELAQEVMLREGLADEEELQSWFIRRIENFLNAQGRRLVGWDEILEGGLAPNATVMSWRGEAGGIAAARDGHDVIMSPNSHVYLDHYQGDTLQEPLAIGGLSPLDEVYAYEPVPAELTPAEAAHVLGAQGNVWTEYMRTTDYVEYMILPRMLALSEVVWSPPSLRSWDDFTERLPGHLGRLDDQGYNFRVPDVLGLENDQLTLDEGMPIVLTTPVEGGDILFTLDGSIPGADASVLDGSLFLPLDETGVTVTARTRLPDGRQGASGSAHFARTSLAVPVPLPGSRRAQGLAAEGFAGRFRSVDAAVRGEPSDLDGALAGAGSVPSVTLPENTTTGSFGLRLTGYVNVPRQGIYTFYLSSDDGSRLSVADRLVVDHDGSHSMSEKSGQVALHRGWHALEVTYFQAGGAGGLHLEMEGPELSRREVPASWLAHLPPPALP